MGQIVRLLFCVSKMQEEVNSIRFSVLNLFQAASSAGGFTHRARVWPVYIHLLCFSFHSPFRKPVLSTYTDWWPGPESVGQRDTRFSTSYAL